MIINDQIRKNDFVVVRYMGFPRGSDGKKKSAFNARDLSLIPGLGRSPGEENDYPLQDS